MPSTRHPILQGVIEDNEELIREGLKDPEWKMQRTAEGWTACELIRLLDRTDLRYLLMPVKKKLFQVLLKGESKSNYIPLNEFEKLFNFHYSDSLVFEDYETLKQVQKECPYILRWKWLVKENYERMQQFSWFISEGYTEELIIGWINDKIGYGAFAARDIEAGTYIGTYTGEVRRLAWFNPDHNAYCFLYPTRWCGLRLYAIDGMRVGNELRFMNHSSNPNVVPYCVIDRNLLHQIFCAKEKIPKGTELTWDYGRGYWKYREGEVY